jgi:hypothetical protein
MSATTKESEIHPAQASEIVANYPTRPAGGLKCLLTPLGQPLGAALSQELIAAPEGKQAMTTTLSAYLTVENHLSQWQTLTAKTPAVQTATKYFEQNVGAVTSAKQLVANPRLFNYAMTAFGLGDRIYAKGLMQKVLQQGVTSSTALANTLHNSNIFAFAKAFDFADNGSATTASSGLVDQVVNKYVENALEIAQGQQNPGVQLALYFQSQAPNVTSVYQILADKNLLAVVQTALGISPMTAAEPIDTQANMLTSQLKLSDFQDPAKLQKFIERFCAQYDANNNTPAATTNSASATTLTTASLFQTASSYGYGIIEINPATLLSAANTGAGLLL